MLHELKQHLRAQPSSQQSNRGENTFAHLLTKTRKQFDCSVFDGPISGIVSQVFDVRRDFSDGIVVQQFGVRA